MSFTFIQEDVKEYLFIFSRVHVVYTGVYNGVVYTYNSIFCKLLKVEYHIALSRSYLLPQQKKTYNMRARGVTKSTLTGTLLMQKFFISIYIKKYLPPVITKCFYFPNRLIQIL